MVPASGSRYVQAAFNETMTGSDTTIGRSQSTRLLGTLLLLGWSHLVLKSTLGTGDIVNNGVLEIRLAANPKSKFNTKNFHRRFRSAGGDANASSR